MPLWPVMQPSDRLALQNFTICKFLKCFQGTRGFVENGSRIETGSFLSIAAAETTGLKLQVGFCSCESCFKCSVGDKIPKL